MKKNFLLLFLMALLPLAGRAADPDKIGANTVLRFNCYTPELQAEILSFVDGVAEADAKDLVIPATVDFDGKKYKVVRVFANAFKNNTTITTVTFDKNLTEIQADAFTGCKNLTTVNFAKAEDLTTIAPGAFTGTAITALDLSKNTKITTIGNLFGTTAAVKNPTLTEVKLSKKVTTIADGAFQNCTALTTVTFEAADGNQTIGEGAFAGTAIATLDLSKTKIGTINELFGATAGKPNEALTTVIFPNTVNDIVANAFQYCTSGYCDFRSLDGWSTQRCFYWCRCLYQNSYHGTGSDEYEDHRFEQIVRER